MKKTIIFIIAVMLLGAGGATYVLRRSVQLQDSAATPSENVTTVPPSNQQTQEMENTQAEVTTVKYSDAGFEPREITITKGTTVTFVNNTEIPLWAVTNPHPDHTDYPAFDAAANRQQGDMPKPGEDFAFTFEQAGTFGYHNHAAPEHTGTIIVKE